MEECSIRIDQPRRKLSPKTVLFLGMSTWLLAAARSLFRPGNVDGGWTMSRMHCWHLPVTAECNISHNLELIRYLIGSQCSSFICSVTWSRRPRPATRRTRALRTLRKGYSVVSGSPVSNALQWSSLDITSAETSRCMI